MGCAFSPVEACQYLALKRPDSSLNINIRCVGTFQLILDAIFLSGILQKFKWGDILNSIRQDIFKFSMHLMVANTLGWIMLPFFFFPQLFVYEQLMKSQHSWQILAQLTNQGIGSQFVPANSKLLVALAMTGCFPEYPSQTLNSPSWEFPSSTEICCYLAIWGVYESEGTLRDVWDAGGRNWCSSWCICPGVLEQRRSPGWVLDHRICGFPCSQVHGGMFPGQDVSYSASLFS